MILSPARRPLSGQADSAEAMQKAVVRAGNVHGVSQGKRVRLPHPEDQEQVESSRIHQGGTLATIAQHFSGNANPYPRILCGPSGRHARRQAALPRAEDPESSRVGHHRVAAGWRDEHRGR